MALVHGPVAARSTSDLSRRSREVKASLILAARSLLKAVHILFTSTPSPPLPAALRLEISAHIDKKKSEIYFSSHIKNILTENRESTLPQNYKILPLCEVDSERFRELTESAHARIFAAFGTCIALALQVENEFQAN